MTIDALIARIRKSPVQKTFFHFTDTRNLTSIAANGLLSRRSIATRGLEYVPGGNRLSRDLDDHYGYDDYVHLCFRKQHGMAHTATKSGQIAHLRWLAITPDVLTLPGVLIAPDNSVKTGVRAVPVADALPDLDLDILYDRSDWAKAGVQKRLKAAERYEILVPKAVALAYIRI